MLAVGAGSVGVGVDDVDVAAVAAGVVYSDVGSVEEIVGETAVVAPAALAVAH